MQADQTWTIFKMNILKINNLPNEYKCNLLTGGHGKKYYQYFFLNEGSKYLVLKYRTYQGSSKWMWFILLTTVVVTTWRFIYIVKQFISTNILSNFCSAVDITSVFWSRVGVQQGIRFWRIAMIFKVKPPPNIQLFAIFKLNTWESFISTKYRYMFMPNFSQRRGKSLVGHNCTGERRGP